MGYRSKIPIVTILSALGSAAVGIFLLLFLLLAIATPEIRESINPQIAEGLFYLAFYSLFVIANSVIVFFRKYRFAGASIATIGILLIFSLWIYGIVLLALGLVIYFTKEKLDRSIMRYLDENGSAALEDLAKSTGKNEAELEIEINSMISKGEAVIFDKAARKIVKRN